ncbi:MAG TPA: hypothetical protein PL124_11140 [Candidatus Cloacimonadota bacterium]|nr:hypothetical protein [Candidatus Cloacimonadota bacterium]HPS39960.1 hypothetical protein [Candidatus Cloacimonadota bacterium]
MNQVISKEMLQVVLWVAGILITALIGLITYVWKTSQAEIRALRTLNDKMDEKVIAIETRVTKIEGRCSAHDRTDLSLESIRIIMKQELDESMKNFGNRFKLELLNEGYIQQLATKTKPRGRATQK